MIKKEIAVIVPHGGGEKDYFPPKSLLKKLAIPSKNPGWRVTVPTGVPPACEIPPQPQLTFSFPLSSLYTIRAQGSPVWHFPEHSLFAERTQVSLHSHLEQTTLPALSVVRSTMVQALPSAQFPVQEPLVASQAQVSVTSPPLQWHSAKVTLPVAGSR
jgi:hypothetical protein